LKVSDGLTNLPHPLALALEELSLILTVSGLLVSVV
jgi:hypothetical protein